MSLKCKTPADVLKAIKENDVKYVDLRFTDPRGKWHHTAQAVETIDDSVFADGLMFDGSSIAGWKAINESDMTLMLDPTSAVMDPFAAQPSMILFCDIYEPSSGQPYARDPRSTAKLAEAHLKAIGLGDTAYFGPEAEFFVFDDVRFEVSMNRVTYEFDSEEGPYTSNKAMEGGNIGHRPAIKGGYFPVAPVDSMGDLRAEMLTVMKDMGLPIEKHHHEVASSQNELGFKFDTLVRQADAMQIYKYVVHNVAASYGKTATFLPKPMAFEPGSGLQLEQSLQREGRPVFAGQGYADLSPTCLHYLGGILHHARALNAFTNPTTNSYRRLAPGGDAPRLLAYAALNRSAAIRLPFATRPEEKRIEVRFADPSANPYLAFAALLLAGLDGIARAIDPGEAMDRNLYDLPPEETDTLPTVCRTLAEALDALEQDRDFLTADEVFSDDMIDAYVTLKRAEIEAVERVPHPVEFQLYYSC